MGKNTLKRKIKILSYLAAFIFMVGVHTAMDKISANKEQASETAQKPKDYPEKTRSMATTISLSGDSLYAGGNEKTETDLLFK